MHQAFWNTAVRKEAILHDCIQIQRNIIIGEAILRNCEANNPFLIVTFVKKSFP